MAHPSEAAQTVLVPLTAAGRVPVEIGCSIALGNLGIGPGSEAGKLLVAASDALGSNDVTADVALSVIELAGRGSDPWARALQPVLRRSCSRGPGTDPLVHPGTSRPWSDSWRKCSPARSWSLDLSCSGLTDYPW